MMTGTLNHSRGKEWRGYDERATKPIDFAMYLLLLFAASYVVIRVLLAVG